jgi:hypothetical protein
MKGKSLKIKLRLVVGIIGLTAVIVCMGIWALKLIDSIYTYRSPLASTPPLPGKPLGMSTARRLVFVLIDGERFDTSLNPQIMPTLNKLRLMGATAVMHSQAPSFSQTSYTVLLTGAWPYLNDGPAFNQDYADIWNFSQDNLFRAADRSGLTTAISGYYWFEKLVPQDTVTNNFYTSGEDRVADDEVVEAALPWLQNEKDQFILIHLDQVDYAGHHKGGPKSQAWIDASARVDNLLNSIVNSLDLSQDAIIICSDHGHVNSGGHGGADPVALTEPFILAGAGIKPGKYADINQVDIAPTLAALLGTNIPASSQGRVLTEMLDLPVHVQKKITEAVKVQQTHLLEIYAAAIGRPMKGELDPAFQTVADFQKALERLRSEKLLGERIPRAILAIFLFSGIVVLFLNFSGKKAVLLMLFSILSFILFALGYGVMTKWTYSLSTLESQTQMISYSTGIGLVSALVPWLVYMLIQKPFNKGASLAAFSSEGLTWSSLIPLFMVVLFNFTVNGFLPTWTLPNISVAFFNLLAMFQLVLISLFGLVLIGISALVGSRRV